MPAQPSPCHLIQSDAMRCDAMRRDAMRRRLIQDEGMWVAQLHKDRDLIAQFDAVQVTPVRPVGSVS
jgi:hypothetical protein